MKIISAVIAAVTAITALSIPAPAVSATLPDISAQCAAVMNADTGALLSGKDAFRHHAMASTTKIMTALITLESGDLDRQFTVDSMAIRVEGTSMGLQEGDIVTRRALCYGMLLPSGNDAANAAAVNIAGSLSAFAGLMNKRAAQIGMTDTNFVTPSGLDAPGHYSTAYDMALLTAEALKNKDFREICSKQSAVVKFGAPPRNRTLYNSNKMLAMYDGCFGVKTGFTDDARRCLVSAAERDGCTVIAVTLDAPDDWNDHKKMLDSGFSQLKAYDIRLNTFSAETVGGQSPTVTIAPVSRAVFGLTADEAKQISVKYRVPEFVYAQVKKGEHCGWADIYLNDKLLGRVEMTAFETVERTEPFPGVWKWLESVFAFDKADKNNEINN